MGAGWDGDHSFDEGGVAEAVLSFKAMFIRLI